MTASVSVEPPFFTYPWPGVSDVMESLGRKSVVFGIDKPAIEKLTEMKLEEEVTVAVILSLEACTTTTACFSSVE